MRSRAAGAFWAAVILLAIVFMLAGVTYGYVNPAR